MLTCKKLHFCQISDYLGIIYHNIHAVVEILCQSNQQETRIYPVSLSQCRSHKREQTLSGPLFSILV